MTRRWIFRDGATSWTVPVSPNAMSSPYPTKSRQTLPGVTIRTLQAPVEPFEWTFAGLIRTEDHYNRLLAWSQINRPIEITDHYGRVWSVLITAFDPQDRKPTARAPWRLTYTMRTLMLGRVTVSVAGARWDVDA